MSPGKRRREYLPEVFVATVDLPRCLSQPRAGAINYWLTENGFDQRSEKLYASHDAETIGRLGVPPGVLLPMLFVGYFEELKSHGLNSWHCVGCRSLGEFLGGG